MDHRLHQHRRYLVVLVVKAGRHRLQVVVGQDHCVRVVVGRHSRRIGGVLRLARIVRVGGAVHRQGVGPALIAAVELHYLGLARIGAGQPDGVEQAVGAADAERHLFRAGDELGELARHLNVAEVWHGKLDVALVYRLGHRLYDLRGCVAQDVGARAAPVVQVLIAIHVVDAGALGAPHVEGVRRPPLAVGHAARTERRGFLHHGLGTLQVEFTLLGSHKHTS